MTSTAGRFWSKVDRSGGPDACWPWTAGSTPFGYGVFHPTKAETVGAHRFALEQHLGRPLAPGMQARHRVCDNPPCCNQAHLAEGTNADNVADMVAKDRQSRGSGKRSARMTEAGVLQLRLDAQAGTELVALAERYAISQSLATMIARGQRWRHVGGPITEKYNTRRTA